MTKERKTRVNALLLERIEGLVQYLYPEGHREGRAWRVGSLDIRLRDGLWGDWDGTTESMSRNLIDLWVHARGVNFVTAVREINDWLGIPENDLPVLSAKPAEDPQRNLVLPLIEKPTQVELRQLSELRSISVQALSLAVARGFLWMYRDRKEGRCWLITDSARKSAIGRRLDGKLWECNGKKSKTLWGSWGSYPIGLVDAESYPAIGLVEGSPDFLALFELAMVFGVSQYLNPVAMAGASMSIPHSQLPLFSGKRVRIFIHDDIAGRRAAKRWAEQLTEVAEVDGFLCGEGLHKVDGKIVEDVNDLLRIDGLSWNDNRDDIEHCLDFACDKEDRCLDLAR